MFNLTDKTINQSVLLENKKLNIQNINERFEKLIIYLIICKFVKKIELNILNEKLIR